MKKIQTISRFHNLQVGGVHVWRFYNFEKDCFCRFFQSSEDAYTYISPDSLVLIRGRNFLKIFIFSDSGYQPLILEEKKSERVLKSELDELVIVKIYGDVEVKFVAIHLNGSQVSGAYLCTSYSCVDENFSATLVCGRRIKAKLCRNRDAANGDYCRSFISIK